MDHQDPSAPWDLFDDYINFSQDDYNPFDLLESCNANTHLRQNSFPGQDDPVDTNFGFLYDISGSSPDQFHGDSSMVNISYGELPRLDHSTKPNSLLLGFNESGRREFEADGLHESDDAWQLNPKHSAVSEKTLPGTKMQHKWKDSMIVFSTKNGKVIQKRRKAFCEKRRIEVAMNRVIGACIQCKLRKGSCNFGMPCDYCIKRAGSVSLGQQICMRQNLLATRFDSIDLLRLAKTEGWLRDAGLPATAVVQSTAYLWFPSTTDRLVPGAYVKIPVIEFTNPDFTGTMRLISYHYHGRRFTTIPDNCYAIAPGSLPTTDELVQAYAIARRDRLSSPGPFSGINSAIRSFSDRYCRSQSELPLHFLLKKTLKLQLLFDAFHSTAVMSVENLGNSVQYCSSIMCFQISIVVAKSIMQLETEIFSKLDRLASGSESIGKQNPLATWVCLWTLILSYKEYMVFTRSFYNRAGEVYNLTCHIYNTLTSIYAALYKTTSPLTLDWRTDEVAEMLGRDPQLIKLFCDIKTELFWFYSERDSLLPEDALFKSLIVENESKLVAANIKAAKRRGIL